MSHIADDHPADLPAAGPETILADASPDRDASVGRFGMLLFLASLTMLFLASLVAYWAFRLTREQWPPPGALDLPSGLWLSTLILLASSATIALAVGAVRRDNMSAARTHLWLTTGLATAFMALQVINWIQLQVAYSTVTFTTHGQWFYLLSGLHALHVIGGLIPLWRVTLAARAGALSTRARTTIEVVAIYWHFLDVVWVVLFATIFVTGG